MTEAAEPTAASPPTVEEDPQVSPPRTIKSRYVQRLRSAWDSKLRVSEIQTSFREAVITIRHHAQEQHSTWAAKLQDVLTILGSTRHRERVKELSGDGRTMPELRDDYERRTEHWDTIKGRCNALLAELEEHVGGYTDEFLRAMPKITEEAISAPWDDPREDPWSHLVTFSDPHILTVARETPPLTIDRSCFNVLERHCWSSVSRSKLPLKTRASSLKITCCASATSTAPYLLPNTEIFVGTAEGSVLGLSYSSLATQRSDLHVYADGADDGTATELSNLPQSTVQDVTVMLREKMRGEGTLVRSSSFVAPSRSPKAANSPKAGDMQRKKTMSSKEGSLPGVRIFRGHVYPVTTVALLKYSAGKLLLASASVDKTVRISNAVTGNLLSVITATAALITAMAVHEGLGLLITTARDGTVAAFDALTGDRVGVLAKFPLGLFSLLVEAGPDGRIIVGTKMGSLYVLEVPSYKKAGLKVQFLETAPSPLCFLPQGCLPSYPEKGSTSREQQRVSHGSHKQSSHITTLTAIAGFLLSGDSSGLVVQWDTVNALEVRAFPGHVDDVTAIHVSGDGFMTTTGRDGLILIRNLNDGMLLTRLNRHFGPVTGMVMGLCQLPDSSACDTTDDDDYASKIEIDSNGAPVISLSNIPNRTASVLLTASEDESIVGWSLRYDASQSRRPMF